MRVMRAGMNFPGAAGNCGVTDVEVVLKNRRY